MKKKLFLFILFFINLCVFGQNINQKQWAWDKVGLDGNFKRLTGQRKIKVAIIDDAFQLNHLGLNGYLYKNNFDLPGNNIDDDQNGKIDDHQGWDFSDNDSDVNPPLESRRKFSHGTKVAGIIVDGLNRILTNSEKVIQILPLKSASDSRNNNYITDGYEAIKYAIDQKVDIIICCWSGGIYDKEKEEILKSAQKANIIVIGSAGNFISEKEQYPGAFPWVMNVAALNFNLSKENVSNYGRFIDIALPGDSLITWSIDSNPGYLSGTSAATAFLGGIVSALYSAYPMMKAEDIDRLFKNACEPLEVHNPLFMGKLGAGVLNINTLCDNLEKPANQSIFNNPKAYIDLQKAPVLVFSKAKYPSFKIINNTSVENKNSLLNLKTWSGNFKKDTTIRLIDLNAPFYFKADSFQLFSPSKLKQKTFIYYEAQVIDSSFLYCSGKVRITEKKGIIEDGSGNENYTNNADCKWEIKVSEGKRIKITFDEMSTEAKIDQLYIFNDFGTESPILAIFSGQELPPQITTWTNKCLIWFVSNKETNYNGWKLKFEEVE